MDTSPHLENKRKFWGKMIWISAASLVLTILFGVATYVIGMISAFNKLKVSGAADPNELAGNISAVLFATLLSIPCALAAVILFIVSIMKHRKFSNPTQAG